MPSGAKKRKAAKKKKQLEPQINPSSSSNTSPENEDVKSQDDKGSDISEIDSPASQDHSSYSNPFGEENKEIQVSNSSNAGGPSNVETNHNVGLTSESKNGTVRNESVKGSRDDDDHSSSSSDDESIDTTKKPEVLDGKTVDLVAPTAFLSIVNSVTPEVSASEETISILESASAENTAMPDMIASKKLETAPFRATDGVASVPETATRDLSSKPNEDKDLYLSAHAESPGNFQPESEDQPLIGSRPPVPQRTSWDGKSSEDGSLPEHNRIVIELDEPRLR